MCIVKEAFMRNVMGLGIYAGSQVQIAAFLFNPIYES